MTFALQLGDPADLKNTHQRVCVLGQCTVEALRGSAGLEGSRMSVDFCSSPLGDSGTCSCGACSSGHTSIFVGFPTGKSIDIDMSVFGPGSCRRRTDVCGKLDIQQLNKIDDWSTSLENNPNQPLLGLGAAEVLHVNIVSW